ncbi:MAG: hypothetical protein ACRCXZ_09475 [Patescibacteria group bacterium]
MTNIISALLLTESTKLNKQSGRQVYFPKGSSSKVIKVEEHSSFLNYTWLLTTIKEIKPVFTTSSEVFRSKIH